METVRPNLQLVNPKPPLHARLYWYKLTARELVLLETMIQHSTDGQGSAIWTSMARLSDYSKINDRTVRRMIHGDHRKGKERPGFLDRGILTELAPGSAAKRRSATYRFNEMALELDPRMEQYNKKLTPKAGTGNQVATGGPGPLVDGAVGGQEGGGLGVLDPGTGGPGPHDLKAFTDLKTLQEPKNDFSNKGKVKVNVNNPKEPEKITLQEAQEYAKQLFRELSVKGKSMEAVQ